VGFSVHAIDATGAGDGFVAGLPHGFAQDRGRTLLRRQQAALDLLLEALPGLLAAGGQLAMLGWGDPTLEV
jgi:sugar/nucleoside kinase (ribokinase family)